MNESELEQLVTLEAAKHDCILMRNNSGAFVDSTGRLIRFGLGNTSKKHAETMRSSDRIGITKVVITPAMVGQTIGVFTAIEMKSPDWKSNKKLDKHEIAQKNFIDWTLICGGYAGFVNNLDSLFKIIKK